MTRLSYEEYLREISYSHIQKCRSEYAAAVKAGTGFFYGA